MSPRCRGWVRYSFCDLPRLGLSLTCNSNALALINLVHNQDVDDSQTFCSCGVGAIVATALTACDTGNASIPSEATSDALTATQHKLALELDDDVLAQQAATMIFGICLISQPKECPIHKVTSILALAFGNRPNANCGNSVLPGEQEALADPGPINEQLADAVYELYSQQPVPIYAQWEIARFLASKYQLANVVSIEPKFTPAGKIEYLSTLGVVQQAVVLAQGAANLGTCAVIGHHDHVRRGVMTAQSCGIRAFKSEGITLPTDYDSQSGQVWTRCRALYVPFDMSLSILLPVCRWWCDKISR